MSTIPFRVVEGFGIVGYRIVKEIGFCVGAATLATGIVADFKIKFTDKLGGKSDTLGGIIADAVQEAHGRMVADARAAGADAIVGLRVQFSEVGGENSGIMVAAMAYGTAVKLEEDRAGDDARALLEKLVRLVAQAEKAPAR